MKILVCGGGGKSTVEDNTFPTGPWAPQIPYANQLFAEAGGLYGQGPQQFYPGSTVAQQTQPWQQNLQQLQQFGQQGGQTAQAGQQQALQMASGQGFNPTLNVAQQVTPQYGGAVNALGGVGGAQGQVLGATLPGVTGALNANLSGAGGANGNFQVGQTDAAGQDLNSYFQNALSGQGTLNPFLEQLVQGQANTATRAFSDNVLPSIQAGAVDAGQYGGSRQGVAEGIAMSRLGEDISNITNQLYSNAFDRGLDTQNQAAGMITQGQDQGIANQLNAKGLNLQDRNQSGVLANQAAQIAAQFGSGATEGFAQQGSLTGNMINQGGAQSIQQQLGGLGNLPNLIGAQGGTLSAANQGALQGQQYAQAGVQDQVDRFNFQQQAPYDALSMFQQFISGPYGSTIAGEQNEQNANQYGLPGGYTPPAGYMQPTAQVPQIGTEQLRQMLLQMGVRDRGQRWPF